MLTLESLPRVQRAIADAGLDGWLLYDFHGANPIATGVLGLEGMLTRRIFVLIPREGQGEPVAITHAIEQGPWRAWPATWRRSTYSSWRTLERTLGELVKGKRLAMEYSPGDAVPYLDRVPAGVLELVRACGAEVVTSSELVTRFYAVWTDAQLASHQRAAEVVAAIAREALEYAGERARTSEPVDEHALQARILERFQRAGLEFDHPPIVAAGSNAADPHYEPTASHPRAIGANETVLLDLWAREPGGVFADQTWMASLGPPSARAISVWETIRDARDASIALLRERIGRGIAVRGGEVDDAARSVVIARGFGEQFTHRTGHSIDPRSLHGAGPHIDNLETRDERILIPGVAFSIEPGVYLPGEIGMRTEVNGFIGERELVITPKEYQSDLLLV